MDHFSPAFGTKLLNRMCTNERAIRSGKNIESHLYRQKYCWAFELPTCIHQVRTRVLAIYLPHLLCLFQLNWSQCISVAVQININLNSYFKSSDIRCRELFVCQTYFMRLYGRNSALHIQRMVSNFRNQTNIKCQTVSDFPQNSSPTD